ncbi:hypothetical protein ASPVEDRAFT_28596 [Aspergillus versicolor CBS 583.65]|uniref:Zn(2)-C6 fungal-type domain-containing protein n=1 Tax=Aspergillus versicolor CBS 583.65 TaxID=1036611 RepID=A0A1L9PKE6_ASPVE|nr:uncharacterized protein ASPVEDRAFT_28596 [Aspergillus versicolor CBS 583.65]OJJ01971.1 hypothetical protein ASPVEDRAFT_28596 [Aspergillus versicolor CBS 583.65]
MIERQRVWRACQACRRKKVKCDGEHPCQGCSRNQAECVYVEPGSNIRLADPQYVWKLENRIRRMEQTLQQQSASQHSRDCDQPSLDQLGPAHDATEFIDTINMPQQSPKTNDNSFETVLDSAGKLPEDVTPVAQPAQADVTQLPEPLLQALIDIFYSSYYPIFPIIHRCEFQQSYDRWLSTGSGDNDDDFSFLLYALLAVSASAMPADHVVFNQPGLEIYKHEDLGGLLYAHATSKCPTLLSARRGLHTINLVVALGLLSIYLIENGRVSEAWTIVGNAIRRYQSLDLQEGADTPVDMDAVSAPGNVWWCLYILDCSLSTALSKPLAIDAAEDDRPTLALETSTDPWFTVIADFHITIGRIYKSVRKMRRSRSSHDSKMWDTLRTCVEGYDTELEEYYTKQVVPRMEDPSRQVRPLALQSIAVSSYYIGVVLLYRTCIERFDVAGPESFLRCAEAASNCIRATPQVIATVPPSHFVVQQSRAVYASAKALLHCMRLARNASFNSTAWSDVEAGFDMLQKVNVQWPQIKQYLQLTKEDMHQTQMDFNRHELLHGVFDKYCRSDKRAHQHDEPPTADTAETSQEGSSRSETDRKYYGAEMDSAKATQGVLSSKRGHDGSDDREPKQQRLNSSQPYTLSADFTSDLPILDESNNYVTTSPTVDIDQFLLPDFPALSSEDLSGSFFDDATLISTLD